LKEVFPNAEILIVKNSKNNAQRATVMVKQNGKISNLICSLPMTPLVRDGRITKEHLAGFPIMYNEKQNSLYIVFPSQGWVEIKDIKVAEYKPTVVSAQDVADFS